VGTEFWIVVWLNFRLQSVQVVMKVNSK